MTPRTEPQPTRITTPEGIAYFHIQRAMALVETADNRAMAADGPVGHVRDELTDREWRDLYRNLEKARAALESPR